MWAKRKYPRTACIIVTTEESISPRVAELADVQLDVGALDPNQGVQPAGLTPGEPLSQLIGVQGVDATSVAGEVGHRRQLGGRHRGGLERQEGGRSGHGVTSRGDLTDGPAPPAANAARH